MLCQLWNDICHRNSKHKSTYFMLLLLTALHISTSNKCANNFCVIVRSLKTFWISLIESKYGKIKLQKTSIFTQSLISCFTIPDFDGSMKSRTYLDIFCYLFALSPLNVEIFFESGEIFEVRFVLLFHFQVKQHWHIYLNDRRLCRERDGVC